MTEVLADKAFYTMYAHWPHSDYATTLAEFALYDCSCLLVITISSPCLAMPDLATSHKFNGQIKIDAIKDTISLYSIISLTNFI